MRLTKLVTIAGALAVTVATSANAQVPGDTAADRADARLARIERQSDTADRTAASLVEGTEKVRPFKLKLSLPFAYNSNVENADANRLDAFHVTPSALLEWKRPEGVFRPFARIVADADEYSDHSDNGSSTLSGRIGFRIVDESLGGFTPYAHYTPLAIFGRGFDDHQLTLHTFAAGATGEFDLSGTTLSTDIAVARREASAAVAERYQFGGSIGLSRDIVPDEVSWSIEQAVQKRWFTGGANDGRGDLNFTTTIGLSWILSKKATLDVGATFERNESSRAGKDYSTFDIGPSLAFLFIF